MFVNKVPMRKARGKFKISPRRNFGDLGWSTHSITHAVSQAVQSVAKPIVKTVSHAETQVKSYVVQPVVSRASSLVKGISVPLSQGNIVGVAKGITAVANPASLATSLVTSNKNLINLSRLSSPALGARIAPGTGVFMPSRETSAALPALSEVMKGDIANAILTGAPTVGAVTALLSKGSEAPSSEQIATHTGNDFKSQIQSMGGKNIVVNPDGSVDWTDSAGYGIHTDAEGNSTIVSQPTTAQQIANALTPDVNIMPVIPGLPNPTDNSELINQIKAAGGSNIASNSDGSVDWINSQGQNVHTDAKGNSTVSGQPTGGGSIAEQVASSLIPGETASTSASIIDQLVAMGAKNITRNSDGSVSWTDSTGQSVLTDTSGSSSYEQTIAQQVITLGGKNVISNSDGSVDWTDSTGRTVHTDSNGNSTYKKLSFWERIKAALRGGQSLGSILDDLQSAEQSLNTITTQGASIEQTIRGNIKTGQAYFSAGKGILNAVQAKKSNSPAPKIPMTNGPQPETIFGLPPFVVYGGAAVGIGGLGLLLWKMKNKEKASGE